ncbi:MAG: hypothetical protein ACXVPX_06360 [Actinomycetota bacterium]
MPTASRTMSGSRSATRTARPRRSARAPNQVLARLGDALQAGRSPEERIEALIETYMQGALQLLADAASGDRLAFAEAEMTAASVAAAMDRAADAAACGDAENVAAATASAEALLDLDLADLNDLLL